jgi:hypothetical protein
MLEQIEFNLTETSPGFFADSEYYYQPYSYEAHTFLFFNPYLSINKHNNEEIHYYSIPE